MLINKNNRGQIYHLGNIINKNTNGQIYYLGNLINQIKLVKVVNKMVNFIIYDFL